MNFLKLGVLATTLGTVLASASAAPVNTSPFLNVDLNGDSGAGAGPTQTGFDGITLANSPGSPISLTDGSYAIKFTDGSTTNPGSFFTRNRGAFTPAAASPLYQDFLALARNTNNGLGTNYIAITISGGTIAANTTYEFTGYAFDSFTGTATNRDIFSTTVPTAYQPGAASPVAGSATPTFNDHGNPAAIYDYSASLNVTSNASGVITVYEWADTSSYSNQTATILNGFSIGTVAAPEPTSIGLVSAAALLGLRRKRNA